jgi:chromosome segregation protein
MLLKSIELQGYKTFAGRTSFEFAGTITCIVGPNGSGKSNIADAIRWVLGEQSYRLLRGKKTEDMIFSGSESRSRASMASANIMFDNNTGWLPVDYSEVSITRRAYRDGTNEYLLNGQKVRLRDINVLLATSGLSERTYTIIGQGLVDAALALRAEERRRLFEEAAGIGLYRTRWEEAQRRLETTHRNLERVEDILAELKPRLRSLERQAQRAARYEQVEKDLKMLLLEYYGYHWFRAQRELNEAREEVRTLGTKYEAVHKEQSGLDQQLVNFREEIHRTRTQIGSWHRELSQLHNQRETITRDLAVMDERLRSIVTQQQNAADEFARLEQQRDIQQERTIDAETNTEHLVGELYESRSHLDTARQEYENHLVERKNIEGLVDEIRLRLEERSLRNNRLQAQLTERELQNERQQAAFEAAVQAVSEAEEQLQQSKSRLVTADKTSQNLADIRQKAALKLDDHRMILADAVQSHETASSQLTGLATELTRLNAQMEVLEQAENALSGYATGTQLLLKSAQDGDLSGAEGALSGQLDVPEMYETAIVAALGEYIDAVILGEKGDLDKALELLVCTGTKGSLVPVSELTPPEPIAAKTLGGFHGVASDLVNAPSKLRPAVDLLLGSTLVVSDRETARRTLQGAAPNTRAVTLKGEVFHASGLVSVGKSGESSTISRPRRRRELQNKIEVCETQNTLLEKKVQELSGELTDLRLQEAALLQAFKDSERQEQASLDARNRIALEVERCSQSVEWHRKQRDQLEIDIQNGVKESRGISESLEQLQQEVLDDQSLLKDQLSILADLSVQDHLSQVSYWETQVAVIEQALANARVQLSERQASLAEMDLAREAVKGRLLSFDQQLATLDLEEKELRTREAEIIAKIESLRDLIDPAEIELDRLEKEQDGLLETEAKARQGLSVADRRHSQAQLTLTRKQELLDNLRERIEDDLGLVSFEYDDEISGPTPLPFGEMVAQLPRTKGLPEGLEADIKRLRTQLRRMGSVNPEAQAEFRDVSERVNFLTSQIEDLLKAEVDIREVILELDAIMKREFHKTFEAVAKEFKGIFTRLFGGGSARLLLTDPGDLAETGIEIEARLPGRRSQGLSLLSGGERSLTATALVFSLLKVSPTPFCVLDEVDAMLDEANVGRFRELLRELAENTQFIVITHNRNTVQAADVIYGVTMGRDSASQMISLKLDEVAEVV